MAPRAGIDEAALASSLRRHYGLDRASVHHHAGGEDDAAWAFRVDTAPTGPRYLLKVRGRDASRNAAAAVARHLADTGLPHVVAPIRSSTNALTVEEAGLSLTLYPFVEGRTGVEAGLDQRHWRSFGRQVRRLHETVLPPDLAPQLSAETYRPEVALDAIRRVDQAVSDRDFAGAVAQEVAAFWAARRAEIVAVASGTEELGPQVARLSLPLVLCHTDLHTWNVLIDGEGCLWLIDWDDVALAPKERDLMFVVGGIGAGLIEPHETAWFFDGYGEAAVDPLALSYYRHAWAVQDIGSYAERVLLTPSLDEEARSHAARILVGLFGPGEIVELALGPG